MLFVPNVLLLMTGCILSPTLNYAKCRRKRKTKKEREKQGDSKPGSSGIKI